MQTVFSRGKRQMRYFRIVLPIIVFLFAAGAFAQGGNVAIMGTVMDPSGAVVVGAKITVTQQGTGTVRTDTTNGSGAFNIPSLPPSGYSVAVQAPGFKQYVENVVLLADQIRNMAVHLQLGEATQQITVETSSAQVNTVSQELSQVIERSRVMDLPLNGRNAADLTLLVPGAVTAISNNSGTLQGDTKQIPGAEAIAVNGARPDQIGYNLDGANNEDLMSNTNDPFPFPDAVQEFSVQTNSFDVQYGSNAGAVVNVITKSGTNQWHGDAFEFVRNRAFNARNYFANSVDPLKRNQFGATVGGPILKNRSFIFFGWQKTMIRTINNSTNAYVPIAQNLTGDFTNYLTAGAANNPLGNKTVTLTGDPWNHTPFATTNVIPSSLLDPVALNMTKLLPISSASANGFVTYGTPAHEDFNEYIARFDQAFKNGNHLFGRFYIDRYTHLPTYDGKDLLTANTGSTVQTQTWALGYTSIINSDMVNNLTLDIIRSASNRGQQGGPGGTTPDMRTFGSSIYQLPTAQSGMRAFSVSGDMSIGGFTNAIFVRNSGDIREVLDWTKGKHDFNFGFDLELDQSNINNTDLENASFNFTNDVTGLAMASFLMGYQHTFSQTSGDYSDSRENPMGFFAGDKWKFSPRLTVDYGIRYEPQQVMKEIWGRIEQFRPDAWAAGVVSQKVPSAPPGLFFIGDTYNNLTVPDRGETGDFKNFGPRVGFAWDPTGTGKMSLRGGGGLFFYSRLPGLFLNDAAISAPFSLRIDLYDSLTGASQIGNLTNPEINYPNFVSGFPQRFILANVPKNATFVPNPTVFSLEPNVSWVTPKIYDWNITYEYQLQPDMVVHVSYVGTRGTHLRQDVNINPGVYTPGESEQSTRPYQPYAIIYENRNSGANAYNALQLDLEKRPFASSGNILNQITLLANYTFSKAMDYGLAENGGITDMGSSVGSGMSYYDPQQHAFETGPAVFDHRHHFVASFVWNLPKLAGSSAMMRNLVGGWQWTGIYNFTSGDPLTILAGADRSQTGNNLDRANFVGSGSLGQQGTPTPCSINTTHCLAWLNTSMFAMPALGTYGNSGKGNWRGPSLWDADSGLIKNFVPMTSHENFSFQFRAEFFNLFNHPQWSDPNVTLANTSFGTVTSTVGTAAGDVAQTADSRIIQLALKMFF